MAKIFRTEKLDIAGNIRIASSDSGKFEITDSSDSILLSRETIESDVSSLSFKDGELDSDVSSLTAADGRQDSDISSLVFKDGELDSDISSLQAVDLTHDSDISSLHVNISSNDVVALIVTNSSQTAAGEGQVISSGTMGENSETVTVNFGRTFTSTPVVIAMLNSSNASDPIIPAMVTAIAGTNDACTISFGDGLASNNYKLEIFASLAG